MDCPFIDWEALYLDWFNNFMSSVKFAEYYGISPDLAVSLIERARSVVLDRGIVSEDQA